MEFAPVNELELMLVVWTIYVSSTKKLPTNGGRPVADSADREFRCILVSLLMLSSRCDG